jgi:hypothetical protein
MALDIYPLGEKIAGIGEAWQQGQERARQQALREAFSGGLPRDADGNIDFSKAANIIASLGGDVSTVLQLGQLGEQRATQQRIFREIDESLREPPTAARSGAAPPMPPSAPPAAPAGATPGRGASLPYDPYDPMSFSPREVAAANQPGVAPAVAGITSGPRPTTARYEPTPAPGAPMPIVWGDARQGEAGTLPPPGPAAPIPPGQLLPTPVEPPQAFAQAEPPGQPPSPAAPPIRINTPAEAARLEPGTRFLDPSGTERIVPPRAAAAAPGRQGGLGPVATPAAANIEAELPPRAQRLIRMLAMPGVTPGQVKAIELVVQSAMPKDWDFVVTGETDGTRQYGFINKRTRQVVDYTPTQTGPAGPPVPPGVDPKKYRQEMATQMAQRAGFAEGERTVLGMVDLLKEKTKQPLFAEAVGPFAGAAHEAPIYTPQRLIYESVQSRPAKAFLDRVKQDAQAINTVLQRELLKGGGSITENERTQINQILGAITTSRSPQDAQDQLDNFKLLVRKLFARPPQPGTP